MATVIINRKQDERQRKAKEILTSKGQRDSLAYQWQIEFVNASKQNTLSAVINGGTEMISLSYALSKQTDFVMENYVRGHGYGYDHMKY